MNTKMTKDEFLAKFSKEILQLEDVQEENAYLLDVSEWDSLAQITTISFFDKQFGIKLTFDDVQNIDTPLDLWNKVNTN